MVQLVHHRWMLHSWLCMDGIHCIHAAMFNRMRGSVTFCMTLYSRKWCLEGNVWRCFVAWIGCIGWCGKDTTRMLYYYYRVLAIFDSTFVVNQCLSVRIRRNKMLFLLKLFHEFNSNNLRTTFPHYRYHCVCAENVQFISVLSIDFVMYACWRASNSDSCVSRPYSSATTSASHSSTVITVDQYYFECGLSFTDQRFLGQISGACSLSCLWRRWWYVTWRLDLFHVSVKRSLSWHRLQISRKSRLHLE